MKYTENSKATQSGMTLIELSVVLLVMVGLAGVAVPYVAGMADKAHDSTTASTINTLNQAIAKFKSDHNAMPERLETLTDASGNIIDYLLSDVNYSGLSILSTTDSNTDADPANVILSLKRAGMSDVYTNKSSTALTAAEAFGQGNRTFNAADAKVSLDAATAPTFVYVQSSNMWGPSPISSVKGHLAYAFGGNPDDYDQSCYSYVAMGVGDNSELIGKGLQTAPTIFVPNADLGPEKRYGRFLAVFKVQSVTNGTLDNNGGPCPDQIQPAEFLGVVADMDYGALVGAKASQQWSTSSARQ